MCLSFDTILAILVWLVLLPFLHECNNRICVPCSHLFLIPGRVELAIDLVFDMVCSGNEFIFRSLNLPCLVHMSKEVWIIWKSFADCFMLLSTWKNKNVLEERSAEWNTMNCIAKCYRTSWSIHHYRTLSFFRFWTLHIIFGTLLSPL